jgi:hypothetical protein
MCRTVPSTRHFPRTMQTTSPPLPSPAIVSVVAQIPYFWGCSYAPALVLNQLPMGDNNFCTGTSTNDICSRAPCAPIKPAKQQDLPSDITLPERLQTVAIAYHGVVGSATRLACDFQCDMIHACSVDTSDFDIAIFTDVHCSLTSHLPITVIKHS